MQRKIDDRGETDATAATAPAATARNQVVLTGRVSGPATQRQLPSGDTVVSGRVIVDRDDKELSRSRQRVDTLDCVGWTAGVRRSMLAWTAGDVVEIDGAIRRRFFRGAAGAVSRVEVEVKRTRRQRTKLA